MRGGSTLYSPANATDHNPDTYWAADDSVTTASLTIDFGKPAELNAVLIQEYIALGQRVGSFTVTATGGDGDVQVAAGTTIGNRRIVHFNTIRAQMLTISLTAKACPTISNIEVYRVPTDS
jgi:alpha-L-fucosidase